MAEARTVLGLVMSSWLNVVILERYIRIFSRYSIRLLLNGNFISSKIMIRLTIDVFYQVVHCRELQIEVQNVEHPGLFVDNLFVVELFPSDLLRHQ